MPNIAAVLKTEITRIARKEMRAQSQDYRKSAAQTRAQIAALRRRIDSLEKQLKRLGRSGGAAAPAREEEDAGDEPRRRFSATRFAAQRRRLGLSAGDFAKLLGVSAQSVYKWEYGKARPRARQLEAIAAVRGIGKREAAARLAAMGNG